MRSSACNAWVEQAGDPRFIFLTGDLGFRALEPLRDRLGDRFINAGVAEQNMVSVGAGLALGGMNVWLYSIAPFCYARPFEQIRNDICQHHLPVKLVGNGGGYGYGSQGGSHHALEDYGSLLTLPGMKALIPAYSTDLDAVVNILHHSAQPAYLRLGRCELPTGHVAETFMTWRCLLKGENIPIVVIGPLSGGFWETLLTVPEVSRPDLWVLGELPLRELTSIPERLLDKISSQGVCVVEEHSQQGSVGQQLAAFLLQHGISTPRFEHCHAKGYPSGTYGSQSFHRRESGLEPDQVLDMLGIQT